MLLQNNCINNGVTNSLKQNKEKRACKAVLYDKIKERRGTDSEWLIGVHTQNIPYLSTVTTQHKTKQGQVRSLLMRVKASMRASAQGAHL